MTRIRNKNPVPAGSFELHLKRSATQTRIMATRARSPERQTLIARVLELWQDSSKTTAAIGAELGITKNAVIGILSRADAPPRRTLSRVPQRPIVAFPTGGCLWMDAHPGQLDAHFCGAPVARVGEAWCAAHRKRVYVPQKVDPAARAR